MDFDKIIKTRASIRKYSLKKPSIEKVMNAIEAANHAPLPGNIPIAKFIIIDNPKTITEIAEACSQDFISQSPFLVVVCSEPEKIEIMYDKRAKTYTNQYIGATIENFLLKITDMGLASCWIGAFSDETLRRILNIPDKVNIEAVLPVAYQYKTEKTNQRKKPDLNTRIYFHEYGNKYKNPY